MKIYFAGSIRGGRQDQKLYCNIIKVLAEYGTVLTEHVGDSAVLEKEFALSEKGIFERDVAWLKESDIVVAEVTLPSLGVGYEIGIAESLDKPVLCIYRDLPDRQISAMITGNPSFAVVSYVDINALSDLQKHVDNFLSKVLRQSKKVSSHQK